MSGTVIIQRDVLDAQFPDASVGTVQTIVIPPINLLRFDKKTFSIKNQGPAAFNSGKIQSTHVEKPRGPTVKPEGEPSDTDSDWEDVDTTTFTTLAAAAFKSVTIKDDSRKWWRVVATVAAGTTGARGWVTAATV